MSLMVLLAIYGSLRKGKRAHMILEEGNAKFIGSGYTLERFHMRANSLYPAIFIPKEGDIASRIYVEVYDVSSALLKKIDAYEGVPSFYYRRKVRVKLDDGRIVDAEIYICNDSYRGLFEYVIENGFWD